MPRGGSYKGRESSLKKTIDGTTVIPQVLAAVLNNKTPNLPVSADDRRSLSRAIRMDIDEFRAKLADQLRPTIDEALADLRANLSNIPPGQKAFALSVLIDKLQAIEGKTAASAASVNVQINNYGSDLSKEALIAQLQGKRPVIDAQPPSVVVPEGEPVAVPPDPSNPPDGTGVGDGLGHVG